MANPQREIDSTVRTITDFEISKRGSFITLRVRGNGFLYKQVRSMVGMLIRVGHGQESPERITELLDSCASRTARVPSAPPQGLTLWRVWY
jgi:tRNA pseudouridine38-40 synthase